MPFVSIFLYSLLLSFQHTFSTPLPPGFSTFVPFLNLLCLVLLRFFLCFLGNLVLLISLLTMGDQFPAREYGWTESSGSDISVGPFTEDSDASSQTSDEFESLFARHGPVLEADTENLNMQRDFWSHCAIGFLLDYRKFSAHHLQQIIKSARKIRGVVSVIGRDSFFYFIHFEILEDLNHFCAEGPWSVDGACLMLEKWRPNLVLSQL